MHWKMISRKIAEKIFEKLLTNSEICDIINKLSQRNSMRHGTLKTEQYKKITTLEIPWFKIGNIQEKSEKTEKSVIASDS